MPDARGHGRSARITPGERVDMTADLAGLSLTHDPKCVLAGVPGMDDQWLLRGMCGTNVGAKSLALPCKITVTAKIV